MTNSLKMSGPLHTQHSYYNTALKPYHWLASRSDLSFLVRSLSIETTVLKLPPQAVILENVEHASHLTEDQHTRSCVQTHTQW